MTEPDSPPATRDAQAIGALLGAMGAADSIEQAYKKVIIEFRSQHAANHFYDLLRDITFPEEDADAAGQD